MRKINALEVQETHGLRVAKGEYIIFLDGDDYLNNENVLEKLDNVISFKKPDVVYMGFEISGNREEIVIPTKETCDRSYKASKDPYPNVWSKCWNREFLLKNNLFFPENRFYEDVLFIYNSIMKVQSYEIAAFPVHTYISGRQNSITTSLSYKNIYDTIENIKDMIEINKKEPTEEIKRKIQKDIEMCKKRLEDIAKSNN